MSALQKKLRRALFVVRAAIADPAGPQLSEANRCAAEVLDELDPFAMPPDVRGEVVRLTTALRTLRQSLTPPTDGAG